MMKVLGLMTAASEAVEWQHAHASFAAEDPAGMGRHQATLDNLVPVSIETRSSLRWSLHLMNGRKL